ncbi:conjugative transfer ATPase [Xenorhabdus ehlersii]|uniref:Conjugative transfer ATPase n=1 Tax=Xenorhabdus ehlersii TaxID=290111 RepID=A0A2D0IK91_9GAMM|nr:conjugative transfer ATPase [Xenorhabdus ehlersii]
MDNPNPLHRPGTLSETDEAAIYRANPSIIDYLPWVEYLEDGQCLLLDDGVSVGAVYQIEPIATEGRPAERLLEIRDNWKMPFRTVWTRTIFRRGWYSFFVRMKMILTIISIRYVTM